MRLLNTSSENLLSVMSLKSSTSRRGENTKQEKTISSSRRLRQMTILVAFYPFRYTISRVLNLKGAERIGHNTTLKQTKRIKQKRPMTSHPATVLSSLTIGKSTKLEPSQKTPIRFSNAGTEKFIRDWR